MQMMRSKEAGSVYSNKFFSIVNKGDFRKRGLNAKWIVSPGAKHIIHALAFQQQRNEGWLWLKGISCR